MAVTSNRYVVITWTGDVEYTQQFDALVSNSGSGTNELVTVNTTATAMTIPTNAVGVTIIPPVTNTTATISITSSTGVVAVNMGTLGPSSFALSTTSTTLYLTASATTSGVRLLFS